MKTTLFSVLLFISHLAIAQKCNCPSEGLGNTGKPLKVFSFTNGKKIGFCGYREVKNNDTIYSEITLFHCGQKKPIKEWGAIYSCKVNKIYDSLFVGEISWLPIGKNFICVPIPFYVHKYSFKGVLLQDSTFYRNDIAKYTESQINKVFQKYKKLTKGNHEETTDVANMLFWAYVSGSKEAEVYLKKIPKKFGPFDGVVAEEWDIVSENYEHWKKLKPSK